MLKAFIENSNLRKEAGALTTPALTNQRYLNQVRVVIFEPAKTSRDTV